MPKYSTSSCPNVAKLDDTQLKENHDRATEANNGEQDKPLAMGTRRGKTATMQSVSDKLGIFVVCPGLFIVCMGLA
jgi:hypothetical protein